MFKKRTPKASNAVPKRRLDPHETENRDPSESLLAETSKKRKVAAPTINKPSRNVDHHNDTKEPESKDRDQEEDALPKKKPIAGPKAAPAHIKVITLTDFQPDVCKDFQQTGFCGYGDTCKFLHIRDESRQKKPIEKEWENVTKEPKPESESSPVPFKCPLCKEDYKSPVKTSCNHIFCQKCYMSRFKEKKTRCFICKEETSGAVQPLSKREKEALTASLVS